MPCGDASSIVDSKRAPSFCTAACARPLRRAMRARQTFKIHCRERKVHECAGRVGEDARGPEMSTQHESPFGFRGRLRIQPNLEDADRCRHAVRRFRSRPRGPSRAAGVTTRQNPRTSPAWRCHVHRHGRIREQGEQRMNVGDGDLAQCRRLLRSSGSRSFRGRSLNTRYQWTIRSAG